MGRSAASWCPVSLRFLMRVGTGTGKECTKDGGPHPHRAAYHAGCGSSVSLWCRCHGFAAYERQRSACAAQPAAGGPWCRCVSKGHRALVVAICNMHLVPAMKRGHYLRRMSCSTAARYCGCWAACRGCRYGAAPTLVTLISITCSASLVAYPRALRGVLLRPAGVWVAVIAWKGRRWMQLPETYGRSQCILYKNA